VLRCIACRFGSLYRDAFQCWLCELHVMSVRAVDDESDGYTVALDEEAAFRSRLPSICWVWTRIFSPLAAPW
jgi:hypothetical protein